MGSSVIYPYDMFGIFGNSDFGPVCEPHADWMLARPRERRRSHRRPDTWAVYWKNSAAPDPTGDFARYGQ